MVVASIASITWNGDGDELPAGGADPDPDPELAVPFTTACAAERRPLAAEAADAPPNLEDPSKPLFLDGSR